MTDFFSLHLRKFDCLHPSSANKSEVQDAQKHHVELVDCRQRVLHVVSDIVRIIRVVPRFLQINEREREFPISYGNPCIASLIRQAFFLRYRIHSTTHPYPTSGLLTILFSESQTQFS